MCSESTPRSCNFLCVMFFLVKFLDGTFNLGFDRQKMRGSRQNVERYADKNITKSHF